MELPYYGLKSIAEVTRVASEENVPIKTTGSNDIYDYVIFEQTNQRMQPAIWIGYKDSAYADYKMRHIKVDFPNVFITKYMRVLMIDAYRRPDSNLDIDYVIPGGFILN